MPPLRPSGSPGRGPGWPSLPSLAGPACRLPSAGRDASAPAGRARPSAGRRSRSGCRGTGPRATRRAAPSPPAARLRRGVGGEGGGQPLELVDELGGQARLELLDGGGVDLRGRAREASSTGADFTSLRSWRIIQPIRITLAGCSTRSVSGAPRRPRRPGRRRDGHLSGRRRPREVAGVVSGSGVSRVPAGLDRPTAASTPAAARSPRRRARRGEQHLADVGPSSRGLWARGLPSGKRACTIGLGPPAATMATWSTTAAQMAAFFSGGRERSAVAMTAAPLRSSADRSSSALTPPCIPMTTSRPSGASRRRCGRGRRRPCRRG